MIILEEIDLLLYKIIECHMVLEILINNLEKQPLQKHTKQMILNKKVF